MAQVTRDVSKTKFNTDDIPSESDFVDLHDSVIWNDESHNGVNTQTGSVYTLALSDANKIIEANSASANTITVPPNSSVAFGTKCIITIVQLGAGQTTIVAGAGVTINSPSGIMTIGGQYQSVVLYKRATNEWVLLGAAGLIPLATPTLTATVISATEIDLSSTTDVNAATYKFERSPNGTTGWTVIQNTSSNTYNDTGRTAGTHYWYRVTLIGDGVTYADSGYGTDDDTTSALTQLNAPTGVTLGTATATTQPITWTDTNTSPNEVSCKVQQSPASAGTWTDSTMTSLSSTGATVTGLTASTNYDYRVIAIGDGTTTSNSNPSSTVTGATTSGAFDIMSIGWTRWFDADLGVTTSVSGGDNVIDRLNDQVSNSTGSNPTAHDLLGNASGGDATTRPPLRAAVMNGHACVETAANKWIENSELTAISALPYTLVALINPKTLSGVWQRLLGSESGSARCDVGYNWAAGSSKLYAASGAALIVDSPLLVSNTPVVIFIERNGGGADNIYINETLVVTGSMGSDTNYGGIKVGVNSAEGAAAYFQCGGYVGRILTSTERGNVITALKTKAGI